MKAHGKKVVVKQDVTRAETEGGIALPDSARRKLPVGTVVATGEQVALLEVGDRVQFNGYSGATITIKDQDYIVLDQEDILITLEEGEDEWA